MPCGPFRCKGPWQVKGPIQGGGPQLDPNMLMGPDTQKTGVYRNSAQHLGARKLDEGTADLGSD